ncbi:thioredoxin [Halorubrum distributum JCM 9100]|uniref:Thioredoxin n=2 Tax=Halorubrum distributum TaxID=29283 RepID=M0ESR9_9EURY|nr:thioredoxin family protein [Halorubrum distributum]ELZ49449.1 thioredoxin [Halorubrum distributum JCM 9100]ELZ57317.1 thioredoxin [Halorubrum distributum JCM 10118]
MSSNTVSSEAETADGGSSGGRRPVSLSDEDALDAFVADADAALVEFYTDGCGICASMEPVIGNVARGAETDLAVGMVNPRDDPPLVERFDVRSVPLFVLFVDGEPVARRAEGFIPGDDLTAWVDEHAN